MTPYGEDRAWPFVQGGGPTMILFSLALAAAVALRVRWPNAATLVLLIIVAVLWLLILYFFRDPNRNVLDEPGLVVGPGDGEIVEVAREQESRYLQAEVIRISMFLSVLDVHVQRVPLGGVVKLVEHRPGKFLQAFRPEASEVNEYVAMIIESEYGRILVKQIAGILARRCVNWAAPGDRVTTGQRFGLIKFGSRIDLFLPPQAKLLVAVGDKVRGGITPVARLTTGRGLDDLPFLGKPGKSIGELGVGPGG